MSNPQNHSETGFVAKQPDDEAAGGELATVRQIDATAMKAFAHPLRMAMYDYLSDYGSATATMLARHTGESTGQTSYHLRQLERHGFVTEDSTKGTGRERWWKPVGFRMHGVELAKDSSTRPAVGAMLEAQIERKAAAVRDWYARSEQESAAWIDVSSNQRLTMELTYEEAKELSEALDERLQHFMRMSKLRENSTETDDQTRRVRVYLDLFPMADTD